jgi:hypothetical protein
VSGSRLRKLQIVCVFFNCTMADLDGDIPEGLGMHINIQPYQFEHLAREVQADQVDGPRRTMWIWGNGDLRTANTL